MPNLPFHACTSRWLSDSLGEPTKIQRDAWPTIAAGKTALLLAPTGSGKTLAAFLAGIDRLMFGEQATPTSDKGVKILYISPLKALGVDVDRNLRAPLAGLRAIAQRESVPFTDPTVAVRSGDTPQAERLRIQRDPPDILITTPESLYLILTSKACAILRSVETVIIDEIHALAGTKRGSHLFLSLERLEYLRTQTTVEQIEEEPTGADAPLPPPRPLQRIGLSATQRPLAEIARLLGGGTGAEPSQSPTPRDVSIVDAGEPKAMELRVVMPAHELAKQSEQQDFDAIPDGNAAGPAGPPSIWPAIHPRLIELIKAHRSTMIFVNSRRLAERLASAINELADEELAQTHHGSVAKDLRVQIEDRLKRGELPAIIATSSLELGVDMGAVDLVIQIESPPSVASGMQRIGRAGHGVGQKSKGVIFPKYRGDLLAVGAASRRMLSGQVEETHYPRNPLDILAQQIVAIVSQTTWHVDALYQLVRQAAPFFDLPRSSFDGVLDLLAGRYPSTAFAELRPRINWDRLSGTVRGRKGAQRIAILNGGTIPDRGLYGVFLATDDAEKSTRVGELDEEMVFETQPGEIFLLGASSWQVVEITRDRVLVAPAPGQPGKMPFWRGDQIGRPFEFGKAIGQLTSQIAAESAESATRQLVDEHALEPEAATQLVEYIHDQVAATGEVPTDRHIVVEAFLDEVGDWRMMILSPFGGRVHAPWAMSISAHLRELGHEEIDMTWTDDGIVFRLMESNTPPNVESLFPTADEVEDRVIAELGGTALFAGRFRENAARALLLPKRNPQKRTPLWLQRRKSADLLKVAAEFREFPLILETYRECLRDVFDLKGLKEILSGVERREIGVTQLQTPHPSPFAASLLYHYAAGYIYSGDAPLAERRAHALALDHTQLRELLGSADLRQILDGEVVAAIELELQSLAKPFAKDEDDLHDLLFKLGPLTPDELQKRCRPDFAATWEEQSPLATLLAARRIIEVRIAGVPTLVAAEDAGRLRDALGVQPPPGLPDVFLQVTTAPLAELISRYARTHGPFTSAQVAQHFGLGVAPVNTTLEKLAQSDKLLQGEFIPGALGQEWCDPGVLKLIKRRSLAKLREQIEPVEVDKLAHFFPVWQGLDHPRAGLDALLDVVSQLQGTPLAASVLESEILPARIREYRLGDLDTLCSAGEVVWQGIEPIGNNDGRIALYLADDLPLLGLPPQPIDDPLAEKIISLLQSRGGLFFDDIRTELAENSQSLAQSIWNLVWAGAITNDTLAPLRSLRTVKQRQAKASRQQQPAVATRRAFRSRRRVAEPGTEGRWSITCRVPLATSTERAAALARQLIERYGVVVRELAAREKIPGGFSAIYPVLKAMEESGAIRRGYFIAGLGAAQFAAPGAEDQLRADNVLQQDKQLSLALAATDPASAYGSPIPWPQGTVPSLKPQRTPGAITLIHQGQLLGYLNRSQGHLYTFVLSSHEPNDAIQSRLAELLAHLSHQRRGIKLTQIDGDRPAQSPLAPHLKQAGFVHTTQGFIHRG